MLVVVEEPYPPRLALICKLISTVPTANVLDGSSTYGPYSITFSILDAAIRLIETVQ